MAINNNSASTKSSDNKKAAVVITIIIVLFVMFIGWLFWAGWTTNQAALDDLNNGNLYCPTIDIEPDGTILCDDPMIIEPAS